MTNTDSRDPFETEVRDAFRRKLDTLDSLIPAQLDPNHETGRAVGGLDSAPRVRSGLAFGSGAVRFAAVAAVLGLVAAVLGPTLLLRGNVAATGSPAASHSQAPALSPLASTSAASTTHPTTLDARVVASFGSDELTAAVLGPEGAAYVIDSTTRSFYRVDLETGARLPIISIIVSGGGSRPGKPVLLATGGGDVLILDDENNLWTWQEAQGDKTGRGVLKKVCVPDSATWGLGLRGIGTYVVNDQLGQYNLYVIVPAARQIIRYQPEADGACYPAEARTGYLRVARDVSTVDDMYVDGWIYLVDGGRLVRYDGGQASSVWTAAAGYAPAIAPYFTHLTADEPTQDRGNLYAYDRANHQVVVMRKIDGAFVAAYRAPAALDSVTALFVVKASDGSETLYWTSGGNLMTAPLSAGSAAAP